MITKNRCREFWNPVIFRCLLFFNHICNITCTLYPYSIQISQGFFLGYLNMVKPNKGVLNERSVEGNIILAYIGCNKSTHH